MKEENKRKTHEISMKLVETKIQKVKIIYKKKWQIKI